MKKLPKYYILILQPSFATSILFLIIIQADFRLFKNPFNCNI